MSIADLEARRPQKARRVVQGNRMNIADLEVPVDRVVLAGRVVQENRMSMVDLEVQVGQVVLARQAPIKQGSLVVLGKVARGANRRNARRTANSSRKVVRPVRATAHNLTVPARLGQAVRKPDGTASPSAKLMSSVRPGDRLNASHVVLRLPTGRNPLRLGDVADISIGADVHAIGKSRQRTGQLPQGSCSCRQLKLSTESRKRLGWIV